MCFLLAGTVASVSMLFVLDNSGIGQDSADLLQKGLPSCKRGRCSDGKVFQVRVEFYLAAQVWDLRRLGVQSELSGFVGLLRDGGRLTVGGSKQGEHSVLVAALRCLYTEVGRCSEAG